MSLSFGAVATQNDGNNTRDTQLCWVIFTILPSQLLWNGVFRSALAKDVPIFNLMHTMRTASSRLRLNHLHSQQVTQNTFQPSNEIHYVASVFVFFFFLYFILCHFFSLLLHSFETIISLKWFWFGTYTLHTEAVATSLTTTKANNLIHFNFV